MTRFLEKSFSVGLGGAKYSEGWERIFGKKIPPPPSRSPEPEKFVEHVESCPACGTTHLFLLTEEASEACCGSCKSTWTVLAKLPG